MGAATSTTQLSQQNCIVCGTGNAKYQPIVEGGHWECLRCGKFRLTLVASANLPGRLKEDPANPSVLSQTIRRSQLAGDGAAHTFTDDEVSAILANNRPPNPSQQADQLILWIGDNQQAPQQAAHSNNVLALDAWIGSRISDRSNPAGGLTWLSGQLEQKRLFTLQGNDERGGFDFALTFAGWERYAALHQKRVDSRTAFMAMKFGDPGLNVVVDKCFRPAVRRAGFELRTLTDKQPAGLIDDQIRSAILSGRFVIADLTHGNHGAYWEAGFAEGLGLPVIYTCEETVWREQKTHFDTNHMVTIIWNPDPDELKKSENMLVATIRATLREDAKQTDD